MNRSRRAARITSFADEARGRGTTTQDKLISVSSGAGASARVATRRDTFGRILVPVRINDKGPFYFVVNSATSTTAIADQLARRLNVPLNDEQPIIVHGVTGTSTVPALRNVLITLGGLPVPANAFPVLTQGLEGLDGMLSLIGLGRSHIRLDFCQHNVVLLTGGPPIRPASGSTSVPMDPSHTKLLVVNTQVKGVVVKTIIDTGAESTMGNGALQLALGGLGDPGVAGPIIGITTQRRMGVSEPLHPIGIGDLRILGAHICYGPAPLFEKVGLAKTPAMLLGMNVLSKLANLSFDFTTRTVHFGPHTSNSRDRSRHA